MTESSEKISVAIYSRVSKFDPPSSDPKGSDRIRLYCSQRGFPVIREFSDYGELPRALWSEGSELSSMLREISGGKAKFRMIVVSDLSRICRTPKHLLELLLVLEQARIDLFSMKEGLHSVGQGYSMIRILEAVIAAEKVILGETIRRTMTKDGKWPGRPRKVDDPRMVQRIRDLRVAGMSYREISRRLRIGTSIVFRVSKDQYVSS